MCIFPYARSKNGRAHNSTKTGIRNITGIVTKKGTAGKEFNSGFNVLSKFATDSLRISTIALYNTTANNDSKNDFNKDPSISKVV